MKFRRALKTLIKSDWPQTDLGFYLGVNQSTVSRWANGETRPAKLMRDRVKRLAKDNR